MTFASRRYSSFLPAHLPGILKQLPAVHRYWIAYSGGRDSHALLHAMVQLRVEGLVPEIRAVHVNHNLQRDSATWSQHCVHVCDDLNIPSHVFSVDAHPAPGESPEAAARHARYQAISSLVEKDDVLLTAHHQDDQAETLLLQLLRGAGPHGLAAMPFITGFSRGYHARPLLWFARAQLHDYAVAHQLRWIEDPSNFDTGYERNYLRHEVIPALQRHWRGAAQTLSRSALHAAEAAQLLDELAQEDLPRVQGPGRGQISVDILLQLNVARQRNVLRHWIRQLGLPLPEAVQLQHIQTDVLSAAEDGMPCVRWPGAEVRRYRNLLYAMSPLEEPDPALVTAWNLRDPLPLKNMGELSVESVTGAGLKAVLCDTQNIEVRYRQGGERCKPAGQAHTRELKTLFQELGIPPWRRDRIPLIYVDGQLAVVAGLFYCAPFAAGKDEPGIMIRHTGMTA